MPQTTLYARTGDAIGTVELSDELFAAPVNAAVMHQAVIAQLAGRHLGTHDTKTRGEVRGGGKKPYRQKGTGRAPPGFAHRAALRRRRRRLRPASALVRPAAPAADEAPGPPRRADGEAERRRHQGRSTPSPSRSIRTKDLVGVLGNLQASGRVLIVAPGARREARSLGAQPAAGRGAPGRLPQHRRPPQGRHGGHRAAGAAPASRRCTHDAHGPRRHRPPDHQREVDG